MLSIAYLIKTKKEHYGSTTTPMSASEMKAMMTVFAVLFLIDLALLVYAMYCLFDLELPWYVTLALIILMLSPGCGFFTSIGVIIYHYTEKQKHKMSFSFSDYDAPTFEFF